MPSPSTDPRKERELFEEALELPPSERGPFLGSACGDNAELRRRVEALLSASESNAGFLPSKAPEAAPAAGSGPMVEQAGDCIGRYHLLEKIGEGGCGIVFMAEQREPMRRRVALKILKPGLDTKGVVARFEAERQALALMDHPNIARVLDGGTTGTGRPFFVMELVRGIRITEFCDEKKYSPRERLEMFVQVCQAIQHAHQKGIIHRDLKPSNILVTVNDGVPIPKVIDFGIAKATGQQLTDKTLFTHFHALVGTPAYMSPEQAEFSSLDVDTRTDVYSLGVLLYELLVGRTPFDSKELLAAGWDALRRTLREEEPVRPSTRLRTLSGQDLTSTASRRRREVPQLVSELQGDLDWIVLKCLEKDRGRRYDSVGALAQDVVRHLRDEPIVARPPTLAYRLQKTFQRNRLACTAGALVAVTLVVASGFSTWTLFREKAARAVAEQQTLRANRETSAAVAAERSARQAAYAADMQAAELALKEGNTGLARTLLSSYVPEADAEDFRGIEWRWLARASRDEAVATLPQPGMVEQIVIPAEGRWFAVLSHDGTVRVRNGATFESVKELKLGQPAAGEASPDGRLLALAVSDGVELRETQTWQVVKKAPGLRTPLTFGADSASLFGIEGNQLVRWNLETGTRDILPPPLEGHSPQFLARLGRDFLLAGAAKNGNALAIVTGADGRLVRRLAGINNLQSATASADGRWVAAGDYLGRLAVWSADTGRLLAQTNAHSKLTTALAFSPDGSSLASGGTDQRVRIWELPPLPDGTIRERVSLGGHANAIWTVAFSADGARLFSGGKDATVRVWALPQTAGSTAEEAGDPGSVIIGMTPDGGELVTAGQHGRLTWWTTAGFRLLREQTLPFTPAATPFWADASHVFAPDPAGAVLHWDTQANAGAGDQRLTIPVGTAAVRPLAFHRGESWLAVGEHGAEQRLHLFRLPDTNSVAVLDDYEGQPGIFSRPAAISPDGTLLAYAGPDYSVILRNLRTRELRHTFSGFLWQVYSMSFSPDSQAIAVSSWDSNVTVWDCATGALRLGPFNAHGVRVNHVEYSADGRTLLTTAEGGSLRFWNAANGRRMLTFPDAESTAGQLLSADNRLLIYWDKVTYKVVVMDLPEAEGPRTAAPRL